MQALLLSNSTMAGEPYLKWCSSIIKDFIQSNKKICFIPFAGVSISYDAYFEMVSSKLETASSQFVSLHSADNKKECIENCDAIIVGGGNSFHLLKALQDHDLIDVIFDCVKKGAKYVGWSAGANIAGAGIHTTNDMPIVFPASFKGINICPYTINPHYTEKTIDGHGGESRLQRLEEFMLVDTTPILAMEEGSGIKISNEGYTKVGSKQVFKLKKESREEIMYNTLYNF